MAGIGFSLRRLAREDALSAKVRGFAHAGFVSTGPWLVTVLALALTNMLARRWMADEDLQLFSTLVNYAFSFSLVVSGPLVMVLTRCLSDALFARRLESIPGLLVGGLAVLWSIQAPVALLFVGFVTQLAAGQALLAAAIFLLCGGLWLVTAFVSATRHYERVSLFYTLGMLSGTAVGYLFKGWGVAGLLGGFAFGLTFTLFGLAGSVLSEHRGPVRQPFSFIAAFGRYWDLAVIGFAYNGAIWVDKWIMWLAPGGKAIRPGLLANAAYDSGMFLAYLSIVPALVMFLVSIETRFFEHYVRFYRDIQNNATLAEVRQNHATILSVLLSGFRNVTIVQSILCYLALLVAPGLINLAKGGLELVPIFRYGVLGALFHTLFLFCVVVLSYFDLRRLVLKLSLLFLTLNAGLTFVLLPLGPAYFGYGYFLACLLCFVAAYMVAAQRIVRLPYMTFVANNPGLH